VAQAGSWNYAFVYEITARHYPDLPEQARHIGEAEARQKLVELYFASVGAAQRRDITRLFGWPPEIAARALSPLAGNGLLKEGITREDRSGEWIALAELCA
jgi:hypothetical protein